MSFYSVKKFIYQFKTKNYKTDETSHWIFSQIAALKHLLALRFAIKIFSIIKCNLLDKTTIAACGQTIEKRKTKTTKMFLWKKLIGFIWSFPTIIYWYTFKFVSARSITPQNAPLLDKQNQSKKKPNTVKSCKFIFNEKTLQRPDVNSKCL